jgi:hypothetical protein
MAKTSNLENALNYKQIKKCCLKLALSAIEALESNLSIQHNLNWFKKVFQNFFIRKKSSNYCNGLTNLLTVYKIIYTPATNYKIFLYWTQI